MDNYKNHIEKYLKGELTPAEMRDLEMKALNDPFLADALEGAESIHPNEFVHDVKSLDRKINSSKAGKYIWPLRIAASIALILTITFVVIRISPNANNDQLALQENKMTEESPAPIFSDTIEATEANRITALELEPEKEMASKSKSPKKPETNRSETEPTQTIQEPREMVAETQSPQTHALVEAEEAKDLTQLNEQEKLATKSIADQNLTIEKTQLQELKVSPSPTSISGAGVARKKTAKQDMAAEDGIESISPYQQYLKENVVYPKAAIDNKVEGEVTVSFIVNTAGTLSEFVIEKEIGFGCEEELIRLIKAGPPWQPASASKMQRVTFVFVLPNK